MYILHFSQAVKTIMRPATSKPHEVIDEFLQKCANTGQANEQADKYILKISGKEEYLLGNYPLCQYQVCKSDRWLLESHLRGCLCLFAPKLWQERET